MLGGGPLSLPWHGPGNPGVAAAGHPPRARGPPEREERTRFPLKSSLFCRVHGTRLSASRRHQVHNHQRPPHASNALIYAFNSCLAPDNLGRNDGLLLLLRLMIFCSCPWQQRHLERCAIQVSAAERLAPIQGVCWLEARRAAPLRPAPLCRWSCDWSQTGDAFSRASGSPSAQLSLLLQHAHPSRWAANVRGPSRV